MKESVINSYNKFQIADFDNDLVGMCKAMVDWIQVIRKELDGDSLPETEPLENFYKLDPHHPRYELRKNLRKFLLYAVKQQEETDLNIKLKNIYVAIVSATYVYHMPSDLIIKAGMEDKEFTREDSRTMLLNDNMSPNWLKEPSDTDYTEILL